MTIIRGALLTDGAMKPYFALASFLLLLPLQAGATIFQNNGDLNCTYPVTLSAESITCNDTEYCHFGDEMSIYGSMTLEENLPSSTMCVTTSICFMGSFVCKTYKKTTNICNAVGVSSQNDGTACPNAGSFSFGSTVKLPGNGFFNFGSGWWVGVTMTAKDCDPYSDFSFQCYTSFSTISADSMYSSSTAMISGAALLGVAALVALVSRKRRIARINLADEEGHGAGFEMMIDTAVKV